MGVFPSPNRTRCLLRRGHQPVVRTSGQRNGDKVFGWIAYVTGRFLSQGHEERLNSDSHIALLTPVLEQTQPYLMLSHEGAP